MTQKMQATNFVIDRDREERRASKRNDLPYMTEEGMVLIDRREPGDRRATAMGERQARASTQRFGFALL